MKARMYAAPYRCAVVEDSVSRQTVYGVCMQTGMIFFQNKSFNGCVTADSICQIVVPTVINSGEDTLGAAKEFENLGCPETFSDHTSDLRPLPNMHGTLCSLSKRSGSAASRWRAVSPT